MEWKVPFDVRWCVRNCVAFWTSSLQRPWGMESWWCITIPFIPYNHTLRKSFGNALFFLLLMGGVKNHKNLMVGTIWLLFDTSMEIRETPCTHGYPIQNIKRCSIWICAMMSKELSFPFGHGYHLVQTNGYPNKNQRKLTFGHRNWLLIKGQRKLILFKPNEGTCICELRIFCMGIG